MQPTALAGPVKGPTVDVVVTSYNYSAYVERALDSVLAQAYPFTRCTIVDDASSDDSVEVIRRWLSARRDARFELIVQPGNGGQLSAILAGIDRGSSSFVASLDADDLWQPGFLARHLQAHMESRLLVGHSSCEMAQIAEDDTLLSGTMSNWVFRGRDGVPNERASRIVISETGDAPGLEGRAPLRFLPPGVGGWPGSATSGMVFRRSAIETFRPTAPGRVRTNGDRYFAELSAAFTGAILIDEPLACYRRHGANLSGRMPTIGHHVMTRTAFRANDKVAVPMLDFLIEARQRLAEAFGYPAVDRAIRHYLRETTVRGLVGATPPYDRYMTLRDRWRLIRRSLRGRA